MTPDETASIAELKTLIGVLIQRGDEDRRAAMKAREKIDDIHGDQMVAHADFVAHIEADERRFQAMERSISVVDRKAESASISRAKAGAALGGAGFVGAVLDWLFRNVSGGTGG